MGFALRNGLMMISRCGKRAVGRAWVHTLSKSGRLGMWEEEMERANAQRNSCKWIDDLKSVTFIINSSSVMLKDIPNVDDGNPLTIMNIAKHLNVSVEDYIVATINGCKHDLCRDLVPHLLSTHNASETFALTLLPFQQAKEVFWHSSAHILGSALESFSEGALLSDGPALQSHDQYSLTGGFFYDAHLPGGYTLQKDDMKAIKKEMEQIVKKKYPFQVVQVSRDKAMEMFAYNPLKISLISKIPETDPIFVYRCGEFIDLCRGAHVPHTGYVKALDLTRLSSAVDESVGSFNSLQRVYGISFPDKVQLKTWRHMREEAVKRDHRIIGKRQKLFMMNEHSKGSVTFLPHGTRVVSTLLEMLRKEYRARGYEEVITPQIFDQKIWEISGHWQNYRDDMYILENVNGEDGIMGLKPMNCPGHCMIFKHEPRSYRELPLRLADFSPLHRNELSGALSGLTRLRRFHQDDAHIFCTTSHIESEISDCLEFIKDVYGNMFGFEYSLCLSTRPEEKYVGTLDQWNAAEKSLESALVNLGMDFKVNEGDGAFYGPKIDITLTDALGRSHQCGTIQLDFQLPERFELKFQNSLGKNETPVIVHRAILGSLERMMAILIEHFGGRWPFWLSPRQCIVCSISSSHEKYAEQVYQRLKDAGYWVDVDTSGNSVSKKVREAQVAQYNFIIIVGDEETDMKTISVRSREGNVESGMEIDHFLENLKNLKNNYL